MRPNHRLLIAALVAGPLLVSCSDRSPTGTTGLSEPADPATSRMSPDAAGLPIYGHGALRQATPRDPCAGPMHRQFDFWLGDWNVFDPDGVQVGTNFIRSELDGCVVSESWMGSGGIPGRSINTFDAETGEWHQTWTSANFSGHLRMAGGLDAQGRMVLTGQREAVNQGFTLFDEFVWTVLGPDRVRQVGRLEVPAVGFEGEFIGIYERSADVTPAPETPTTGCQPGGPSEQSRQLDFWLGEWSVSAPNGLPLGSSEVTTDLSGCLIEERFRTPKGYGAVSFAYFDFWEQRWYRTLIDSEGERVELSGGLVDGAMVLSGSEGGPAESGASVELRVTVEPVDASRVRQVWEVSSDGGTTWKRAIELLYTRR